MDEEDASVIEADDVVDDVTSSVAENVSDKEDRQEPPLYVDYGISCPAHSQWISCLQSWLMCSLQACHCRAIFVACGSQHLLVCGEIVQTLHYPGKKAGAPCAEPDYELYLEDALEEGGSDAEEDKADDSDENDSDDDSYEDDSYEDDSYEDDSYEDDEDAEIDDGEHIVWHVCSCAIPGDQSSQGDPGPCHLSPASSALTGSVSSNLLPHESHLQ